MPDKRSGDVQTGNCEAPPATFDRAALTDYPAKSHFGLKSEGKAQSSENPCSIKGDVKNIFLPPPETRIGSAMIQPHSPGKRPYNAFTSISVIMVAQ